MNYSAFSSQKNFRHEQVPAIGILVANLGTPEAPEAPQLRRYLKQFLSDRRVVELPRWQWWPILNLIVLNTRPKKSAEAYQQVWTEAGSPLLDISLRQVAALRERLESRVGNPLKVELGMSYGEPSIPSALHQLREAGCDRVLVLPMYPQYSGSTTASVFDALFAEFQGWRMVPELRTIRTFHDDPGYIRALAASVREAWSERRPAKLLFSFHGIPKRYFENGDAYHCLCHKTARLVAEELNLEADRWQVTFQSLFGKEEWLRPYTDETIKKLAASGLESLDVVCPGFSADCLETLEEIDGENRHYWVENGGEDEAYRYIPALNDRPDHLEALANLIESHLQGWVSKPQDWDSAAAEECGRASAARAEALQNKRL